MCQYNVKRIDSNAGLPMSAPQIEYLPPTQTGKCNCLLDRYAARLYQEFL
jgi:hypothetical protein